MGLAAADQPSRQSRWIMLTCSLALVGLLLASQSQSPGPQHRAGPRSTTSQRPLTPSAPRTQHRSTSSTPTTTAPGRSVAEGTGIASHQLSTGSSVSLTAVASPPWTTTTTTTTTPIPLVVSPSAATPSLTQVITGWLESPTSISSTYPLTSVNGRSITATWSGASSLTLALRCPSGSTSTTGPSGLHLQASEGDCTMSIAGPADVATTTFQITVSP